MQSMQTNENQKIKLFSEKDKPLLLILSVVLLSVLAKVIITKTDFKIENPYISLCVVQLLIYILPCVFYCMLKKGCSFSSYKLKSCKINYIPMIFVGAILMFFLVIVLKYTSVYVLNLKDSTLRVFNGANDIIYIVLAGVIVPAITEEMLLRGVLFDEYLKITSPIGTIVITAFVFALIHFSPANLLVYFGAGLLLGIVTYVTNSVIPAIILHGVNNLTAVFTENIVNEYANVNVGGAFALVFLTCILLIVTIFWLYMLEKIFTKKALSEEPIKNQSIEQTNIFKIIFSPLFLIICAIFIVVVAIK